MKEETKKTKPRVRRTTTKKPTRTKAIKKDTMELNETINVGESSQRKPRKDNLIECKHCHKVFEKGYSICPHCHKRQGGGLGLSFLIIFAALFLLGIIVFHFVDKYVYNHVGDDYKENCVLVDYENLVRHPKDYRGQDVKIIGEVVSVEGYDTGFGNEMTITINANLFENSDENLITITYKDKDYKQGFIAGDMITAYGVYDAINGNIPNIKAKIIVFGK